MKKILNTFQNFVDKHPKLASLVSCCLILIGSIASFYSKFEDIVVIIFACGIMSLIRIITYKNGKLPIVMSDKTWNHYRWKYPRDEAEEKYEKRSLDVSSICIMIGVFAVILLFILEMVDFLFNSSV